MNPLIGNLLGDDSLRFTHKGLDGKSKFNSNALYTITLKDKDYIYYLPPAFGDGERERKGKKKYFLTLFYKIRHYSKVVMRGTVNTFYRGSNPLNAWLRTHTKKIKTLLLYLFFFILC